eukprot:CAMPEP_0116880250 /NCGR_PEP_ID=MMETSP0463-20121206/12157_1 /TAXON_ID=181622 /ORGANISM="Strombidinopsis sp, Strain SopsisLIS2011" /LENGTH=144 /DNA_ID=CAMNT_0004530597 /DNA_START=1004 /DNA_END=1438 /DNA_ORIENTATION=-
MMKLYKDQEKNDEQRRLLCPALKDKELFATSPIESFHDLEAYANFVLEMVKLESTYFDVALDKIYMFTRIKQGDARKMYVSYIKKDPKKAQQFNESIKEISAQLTYKMKSNETSLKTKKATMDAILYIERRKGVLMKAFERLEN